MTSALLTRIAAEHAGMVEAPGATTELRAHRRQALQKLMERGLPSTRDENWRYANLRTLEGEGELGMVHPMDYSREGVSERLTRRASRWTPLRTPV